MLSPLQELLLFPGKTYAAKVKALGPIAYWPMWEASGLTAYDISGYSRHGVYQGVDPVQSGIGDGKTCPYFDGANDYCNVYTASLAAILPAAEGTLHLWIRVFNAGVWTNGLEQRFATFVTATGDYIILRKSGNNNQLDWLYKAGGVAKIVSAIGITSVGWLPVGITVSATVTEMRAYLNGVQTGLTQGGFGAWGGALLANTAAFGASNTTPLLPWNGYVAHGVFFPRALSADEMLSLSGI
jgi:hypothetical protein